METPKIRARRMKLKAEYANKLLGIRLGEKEIAGHLEKMRFRATPEKGGVIVEVPPYRTDILHPIDLVEDVAISYGYMNFSPELPKLATTGRVRPMTRLTEEVRDIMVGYGYTEVKNLVMTGKTSLFDKMNLQEEEVVETASPVSSEHGVARNRLLPSLMNSLEHNRNRTYPQKIYEVGEIIDGKGCEKTALAAVTAHPKANFSEIKGVYEGVAGILKRESKASPAEHASFIPGRAANAVDGVYGEISPRVLSNFGLEMPVAGFELILAEP